MNSNPTPTEGPGASPPAEHPRATKPTEDPKEHTRTGHTRAFRFKDGSQPHRKRKHRHRSRTRDSEPSKRHHREDKKSDPTYENSFNSTADTFRESLFDALGDDEGAAYWESVYGQPIHNYRVPDVQRGPEGELEQMTEEEYVDYVRRRMWERTREGMLAEQERLRAERQQKRKEEAQRNAQSGREEFERAMDESLRRGAQRKRAKTEWGAPWAEYLERWETIRKVAEESAPKSLRNLLFWPVRSGKRVDVRPQAVEEFMRHAPPPADLLGTLKAERIRWHPDKIQHRYGALGIDDTVMRSVTEVFQIVDGLWNEERERQK
ncbi:hypothetical protein DTO013E5_9455 [Penicillium roqueforti]|uniref:Uncharacterized protein n=1 Tax=Penicillium roqueforti (strain FM164) TaxID=1365484 RepID=W6QJZ2_PENRF|nr:uncharacterized protein LCP9604111_9609 [Penicillium roqueforti]CDM37138.1 unnamed protein product [Penicillium roqueforti FM164]KAF9238035.1 hypothetical protein LCP9604111_9609 [Penicillium roqueforti]KAI1833456.1 hypothetical protein CBS147337_5954 [Penicillium roqueforti]KAI2671686.1 hypothetical protein LCP963914a_9615 [Penicillium roqueforti]KAI2671752.1 hypothetical protein CBS147355_8395 [Penicillium roqueforti]